MLIGFVVGVSSGLGISYPLKLYSKISGEPITKRLTNYSSTKSYIDSGGEIVAWQDNRNGNEDIYYYNLTNDTENLVTSNPLDQRRPQVSDGNIAYEDFRDTSGEIYLYDTSESKEYKISNNIILPNNPAARAHVGLYKNYLTYINLDGVNSGIYLYDLSVDTDTDGIPNYKDPDRVFPDPAEIRISTSFNFEISVNEKGVVWQTGANGSGYTIYDFDTATKKAFVPSGYNSNLNQVLDIDSCYWYDANAKILYRYNLSTDSDEDGTPNYLENPLPNPDTAITTKNIGAEGLSIAISYPLDAVNGKVIFAAIDANNESNAYYYDFNESILERITNSEGKYSVFGGSTNASGAAWISDNEGPKEVFYSTLEADNDEPTFQNIRNATSKMNYTSGQLVETYQISPVVKPVDATSGILRVDFYLAGMKVATDYTPDAYGQYTTENMEITYNTDSGVVIKARAYDNAYNYAEYSVNITPDPLVVPRITTTRVTDNLKYYTFPVGNSNYVVYDGDGELIIRNLSTDSETIIGPRFNGYIRLNENFVMWNYPDGEGGSYPALYQISNQNLTPMMEIVQAPIYLLSDDYIFWTKDNGLYKKSLTGGDSVLIETLDTGVSYASVYQNKVAFISGGELSILDLTNNSLSSLGALDISVSEVSYYGDEIAIIADGDNESLEYLFNIESKELKLIESSGYDNYDNDISMGPRYIAWADDYTDDTPCEWYQRIRVYDKVNERFFNLNDIYTESTNSCYYSYMVSMHEDTVYWASDYPDENSNSYNIYQGVLEYQDIIKPEITSVTGLSGTTGETARITVSATDNVKATMAKISVNGGAYVNMTGTQSPFTYTVSIPEDSGSKIPISIKVYDVAGNNVSGSYNITVADNDTPFVASIEGNSVTTGESTVVKVRALDNVAIAKAEISIDGSAYSEMTFSDGLYTYNYTAPTDKAGNFVLKVRVTDSSGKIYEKSDGVMVVTDNDPPTITKVVASEISYDRNGQVTVYATDNIAPVKGMITFDNIFWSDMDGTASPFTYSIPNSLIKGKNKLTYYVRVYDAAGNYDTTEPNTEPVVNNTATEEPQSAVAKALTLVQGVIENVVKNTPEPVAKSFPYILFATLLVSAYVFTVQARKEAEQASKKLEMVRFRKVIAEEKSNFVILVSHYLRTPLTLISSGIDEMLKDKNDVRSKKIHEAETALNTTIAQIVANIEDNAAITSVKNPDVNREGIRAYLSPFIVIPALAVGGLVLYANYLFRNVAQIEMSTLNQVTQLVIFVVAVQVFAYYLRKKQNQHQNLKYFNQTIEYQVAVDEARTELLVAAKTKINTAISDLTKALGKEKNEYVVEGLKRLDLILTKMGYLAALRYEDIQKTKESANLTALTEKILKDRAAEVTTKKLKTKVSLGTLKTHDSKRVVNEILLEIIDNAIKFSPKSGTITITGDVKDGLNRITVTDQGKGISHREQLYIFKPFSRTSSALNFEYEGLGLGLYYARSLANMLGGDIYIKSAPGKGTAVTIVL